MPTAVAPLQLKPRTTYVSNDGKAVHIYGRARVPDLDGQRIWWSIQGDHYAEDGRRVGTRELTGPSALRPKYEKVLYAADNWRSIREEDTSEEAKRWWDGLT